MAAKPKRVPAGKQPARQSRGQSGRKAAMSQKEQAQHMMPPEAEAGSFTRAAAEQFRQAAEWTGAAPQVLGWASEAPAKQLESMMTQLWNIGGDGGSGRYMRALAQANVEMVGLLGRRSRAYLDLPAHLAQCQTPQQMWDEQTRFFQNMVHDYQVTNDRMMSCWKEIAAPFAPEEAPQRARKS